MSKFFAKVQMIFDFNLKIWVKLFKSALFGQPPFQM
jgi:hypothetical protein